VAAESANKEPDVVGHFLFMAAAVTGSACRLSATVQSYRVIADLVQPVGEAYRRWARGEATVGVIRWPLETYVA
jgi:hypothetical protein